VIGTSEKVKVQVTWAGGHRSEGETVRPVACLTQLSYYPQLITRAQELVDDGMNAGQIADRLNAEGLRPPKRSKTFTKNAVGDLLRSLGIQRSRTPARQARPDLDEHEWWLRDLAEHLRMSEVTLDAWVRRGWATGYLHPQAGYGSCTPIPPRSNACAPCTKSLVAAQPPPLDEQSSRQHERRTGRRDRR
jgi:hypothetical protein